jgi:hypothetical protein
MEVGDKVFYVPAECHALTPDRDGNLPWSVGRKYLRPSWEGVRPNAPPESKEHVEVLEGRRLREYMAVLRRHPNPAEERRNLVFLAPRAAWPAAVAAVNEDGTVDLDVQAPHPGVTLHERGVRVQDDGMRSQAQQAKDARRLAHSCYPAEGGQPPQQAGQQTGEKPQWVGEGQPPGEEAPQEPQPRERGWQARRQQQGERQEGGQQRQPQGGQGRPADQQEGGR